MCVEVLPDRSPPRAEPTRLQERALERVRAVPGDDTADS